MLALYWPGALNAQTIPDTPSNLVATAVSAGQIDLSWTDNANNEDGFKIERATAEGGPWTQIAQVLPNTTSYRNTGLAPSTTYYYRVRAYNSGGDSAFSNTASVDTPSLCPASVVAWGNNDYGQATPPGGLTSVAAVAGGGYYSLALKSDGTVVGWGFDGYGQASSATNLTGVVAIAAGWSHGLALKSDGAVVGWGYNGFDQASPPTNLTGVVAIAAGDRYSLALKSDGTVVGWGSPDYGLASPPTNLTGVVAIAAGGWHSMALKSDGTVVGWGLNDNGQATAPTGLTAVVAMAAGDKHSLALKSDGTVVGWGLNDNNQASPPTNLTGVVAIAAGYAHSLALKSDGTVVGWGLDYNGQTDAPTGLSAVVTIAAGGYHSLAMSCAPNPPSVLTAIAISSSQIDLSWTDNSSNEDRFGIERATSSTGPWSEIASVNSNVTAYSNTGVTCGQTYFYRVRAYNTSGSPYSNAASANTSTVDTDCDGIPDSWMLQYFGHPTGQASDNSRAADDADGDGMSNLQEYPAGTNPINSASVLRITAIGAVGVDIRVSWTAVTNKTYVVQVTTNLADGSFTNAFTDLAAVVVPAAPPITGTNYLDFGAATNGPSRFYRIKLVSP
jgi:alpha-tubulin suppressor-like RCC1 family protein